MLTIYIAFIPKEVCGSAGWVSNATHYDCCHYRRSTGTEPIRPTCTLIMAKNYDFHFQSPRDVNIIIISIFIAIGEPAHSRPRLSEMPPVYPDSRQSFLVSVFILRNPTLTAGYERLSLAFLRRSMLPGLERLPKALNGFFMSHTTCFAPANFDYARLSLAFLCRSHPPQLPAVVMKALSGFFTPHT